MNVKNPGGKIISIGELLVEFIPVKLPVWVSGLNLWVLQRLLTVKV